MKKHDKTETGKALEVIIPESRVKSRLIDLVSYAPDAGFYYLLPKAVVQPVSEEEIKALFAFSKQHNIPLTFRAAGTSLSGQSITDGILVDISQHWNGIKMEDLNGDGVRVQPGAIGAMVNAKLKALGKKIGPDPASISSAMIGGILSNNASGMCCGVSKNSYHTTRYIRFILPNGMMFSTENKDDYSRFKYECADIYDKLLELRERIHADPALFDKIRRKYKTKNTVGYSLNAFVDFSDPLDILAHLLIGGEGTLGFISEAVLDTVPDYPEKATAMLYFTDIYRACDAILPLKMLGAEAVELMDRSALRSVDSLEGVPEIVRTLPAPAAALLVEFQAYKKEQLQEQMDAFNRLSPELSLLFPALFTTDKNEQAFLWKIRKGMFPAVGAVRASGTTVILEDIAFPVEKLGNAIADLQQLFKMHGYQDAIIFGHAKDGNIHFVVTQAFDTRDEIRRYDLFIRDVVTLVVNRYDGALKAEHGTGRNMAPFVEAEWGGELYAIMKELKQVIDPSDLLNPGVIINTDLTAHIKNLKDLPRVEEEVDKCIECGFCEHRCPSRNITLTPRQRIVVRRELRRLTASGNHSRHNLLLEQYQYDGLDTCAVDGLCATACPVDINTGSLVKRLRSENHLPLQKNMAAFVARNFRLIEKAVYYGLRTGSFINSIFGDQTMRRLTLLLRKLIPAIPLWNNQLQGAPSKRRPGIYKPTLHEVSGKLKVLYFPACINRVMGDASDPGKNIIDVFIAASTNAGIEVVIPDDIQGTCCGQIFSSKGYNDAYVKTANETIEKLYAWTDSGTLPVVLDISSCTQTLYQSYSILSTPNKEKFSALRILDSVEYIRDMVLPGATIRRKKKSVVLHPVCSLEKMGLNAVLRDIAKQCADEVVIPLNAGCCGMAGDRGFLFPELTASATAEEAAEVSENVYDGYYSSGKTCEIALSEAVKKNYTSILYLLDDCTRPD